MAVLTFGVLPKKLPINITSQSPFAFAAYSSASSSSNPSNSRPTQEPGNGLTNRYVLSLTSHAEISSK